ncbi:anchor protein [Opitutaceae bacterium TAV5]|nr:anchor protein [Opitutaceae bacterium TAV5]
MKTSSIRTGLFLPCMLLALMTTALLAASVPARAAAEVLYTFSEDFESITADTTINGKNGWIASTTDQSVITSSKGTNALRQRGANPHLWAAHAIDQTYAGQADTITFSWKEWSGTGTDLVAGAALLSGDDAATASSLVNIGMSRSNVGGWHTSLTYDSWNGSAYETVMVSQAEFSTPARNTVYTFDVLVNLTAHTYSFTVTGGSVTYTSPAIAIDPSLAFPTFLKLQTTGTDGNTSGGHIGLFDDVSLQLIKTQTVPEPATCVLITGVFALLALGIVRARRSMGN